jgi:hypothetical protein
LDIEIDSDDKVYIHAQGASQRSIYLPTDANLGNPADGNLNNAGASITIPVWDAPAEAVSLAGTALTATAVAQTVSSEAQTNAATASPLMADPAMPVYVPLYA